jgi:Protein of unknown function (DUF1573)
MKKTIIILFASCVALVAASNTSAIFNWNETVFDFGSIKQGAPVDHEFEFTNLGSEPLIISNVQVSCGCTVADFTKDPIAPGAKGYVKASYNAAKAGAFTKTVTVQANTDTYPVLTLKGTVIE